MQRLPQATPVQHPAASRLGCSSAAIASWCDTARSTASEEIGRDTNLLARQRNRVGGLRHIVWHVGWDDEDTGIAWGALAAVPQALQNFLSAFLSRLFVSTVQIDLETQGSAE